MKVKILNITNRDPGWSGPCLLFWPHHVRCFPSLSSNPPAFFHSLIGPCSLPTWALHMLPPLSGTLLPPSFIQLTPHMRSQRPSFPQRNLHAKSGLFLYSVGPVAPFLQSKYNYYKVIYLYDYLFSISLPHYTVSSRMTGPCLFFVFCFLFLTLTTVSPILA